MDIQDKANQVWDKIITFVKENPEQCSATGYEWKIGKNYQFWIANGFGEHFRAQCIHGMDHDTIPKELYTEETNKKMEDLYEWWVKNHYQLPDVKTA